VAPQSVARPNDGLFMLSYNTVRVAEVDGRRPSRGCDNYKNAGFPMNVK